jgi:hypothetical protein
VASNIIKIIITTSMNNNMKNVSNPTLPTWESELDSPP